PPPPPAAPRMPAALGLVALVALAALAGCDAAPGPAPAPDEGQRPQRLATATIRVGEVPLVVEVADERAEHAKGMMFREHLGPDEAMLFIFERDENRQFWMKNTPMDLDLAYVAADGTITQIERMKAYDAEGVFSREPVRFVLEVPAGWFARHGIGVGTKLAIPPDVTRPRRAPEP
ncbi:MAG TPA: DUF192 domain-containing protein, partial [Phycisphaerae bacterium]|nr:DUF192 domain-containing protein [Phycisphaerae bacterium]